MTAITNGDVRRGLHFDGYPQVENEVYFKLRLENGHLNAPIYLAGQTRQIVDAIYGKSH